MQSFFQYQDTICQIYESAASSESTKTQQQDTRIIYSPSHRGVVSYE